ncbi:hypothetical protein N5F23_08625 [Pseudomonas sichuanensis]|uniref:hypothetical protein n=1 Tax=Pseudomonas sichuanensis TaxID=2213015 RepID=UPI00244CBD6F|nr:hypothetical protein [Pseudomonas sichuanensis]MDH0733070.1 hypothetical protein [Pseudomonas sichuanensis]MDH1582656.1 hypothetical protein [Pseudomonas sichuanensis]MDH1592569.1 hypothetical protein [Pseudomonas sichuanensis]MDH1597679.1 hypothetical protein [Pseudomonas sichuanensis]
MSVMVFVFVLGWSLVSSPLLFLVLSGADLSEGKEIVGIFYNGAFALFYYSNVFPGKYGSFGPPPEVILEHPWVVWLSIPMILFHLWMFPGLRPAYFRIRRKWDPTFKRHGEP